MIKIAKVSGECFGVSRAIKLALSALDENRQVYVYKELMHNPNVLKALKEKGIECINSLDGLSTDSVIIIRAHGEKPATYEYLQENGFEYYDATCLNVVKIHEKIEEKYKENYSIIIIGLKAHVEVVGSNGWCNNEGIIIETTEDIDNIKDLNDDILIICHTTFNADKAYEFVDVIKERFSNKNIEFVDSICKAQKAIQISSRKLAEECDLMIVIGGENSTNSKELLRVCQECCNSYKFEDINIFYDWLIMQDDIDESTNIGITAGASVMKKELTEYKNLIDFHLYYRSIKKSCEESIEKYNETLMYEAESEIVRDSITQLMRMNNGGKYIRALSIALGYHIFSKRNDDYYIPLSIAYETFQTAILIHDDVIDNADIRRGKETIPVFYRRKYKDTDYRLAKHLANSMAICIADIALFEAHKHIVNSYSEDKNFGKVLKAYNDILIKTVKGQLIDVELPALSKYNLNTEILEKQVMEIYRLKTAWYSIIGPFQMGMRLCGIENEVILKMLEGIGIAFQIKDDLLGIYSNEDKLGKPASSDISEFKQTILYAYINDQKSEYKEELLKYYGKEKLTCKDIAKVQQIFEESGAKNYAISKMNKLFEDSKERLLKVPEINDKYKNILMGFITYLEIRDK